MRLNGQRLTLTKIDVAEAQLRAAVRMFFEDWELVPIYALANAVREVAAAIGEHLDVKTAQEEYAKARGVDVTAVTSPLRNIANFLKHADRDPTAKIDLEEDHIEIVLFYACHDFGRVAGGMPIEAQVFEAWAYAAATKRVSDLPLRRQQLVRRIIAKFPGLRAATDRAKQKKIGLQIMEQALRDRSLEMAMMREVPSRTSVNAATAPKAGRGKTPRRHSSNRG
jgi:hypothetical protein